MIPKLSKLFPKGYEPVRCHNEDCKGKPGECRVEDWAIVIKNEKGDIQAQAMRSYFCRECGAPLQLR